MRRYTIKDRNEKTRFGVHLFFVLFGMVCLIPFMMVISASFSDEYELFLYGYTVFPKTVSFEAYKTLFKSPDTILNAYKVTVFVTVMHTLLAMVVMSMTAYALARKSGTTIGKVITYYIYFPTLFGGGLVPSYIINTQYLHLTNTYTILIIGSLVATFNIFMIRTFIQQQPASLIEAAKIDGASEFFVYLKVAVPLAKPVLATVAFTTSLTTWNSWYSSMIYMRDNHKITLQHMLQRMLLKYSVILEQIEKGLPVGSVQDIPGETLKMAMLVVSIGPMMLLFPFFQKHFVKGMVVGAVKG